MEQKANTFLETERLGKLMVKYAVPCVISLLVAALYNIVDQIFIANADYLGSYGNAANTVVFPLTVVALSIAVMIGDGCCAFVSISLGRNGKEAAHKSIGSAVLLCIVSGLIMTVIYLVLQEPILTLFGGRVNEETFRHAKEYFFWITLGVPFYMFGQALNPIIRSDGSPKFAMASTLAGAAVNIILDPIFIFVFRWGMMGAAVATVLGQIITAVLAVWYLCHMKAVRLEQSAVDPVFGQIQYTQIPMAVLGIVMKFFQIVISISVGLAAGCIPVVGYNIGAGRKDRAKSLFTCLLAAETIVGAVALLIVEMFPRQLIGIFGAANESVYYTEYAVKCFRVYLCMMVLATVNKGTFIYLQSLGRAFASTAISMVREVLFGVGFALLLPRWFGLDGVLYSMPVSDMLTSVICVIVIRYTYKALDCGEKRKPEHE